MKISDGFFLTLILTYLLGIIIITPFTIKIFINAYIDQN